MSYDIFETLELVGRKFVANAFAGDDQFGAHFGFDRLPHLPCAFLAFTNNSFDALALASGEIQFTFENRRPTRVKIGCSIKC